MAFRLAIIIPAYNEARRLAGAFSEIRKFRAANPGLVNEIIFVDDGSRDATAALINDFVKDNQPARLVSYGKNRGKGYAVRQGISAGAADYYLVADADMSTSLFELAKFLPLMAQGAPVIIGTRKGHGARLLKKQPWRRQKMGEIYAGLARLVTGVKIKDFGCGFKVFSRRVARAIFTLAFIDRWIWDTEILYLARRSGYPIAEVGVDWADDEDTRVDAFRETFRSVWDLLRIYWGHLR
jgi:dolichyl-phosphate beta-glucosyltransferase